MVRRKPQSAKEHRAQLQLKRAVKRGDTDRSELPNKSSRSGRGRGRAPQPASQSSSSKIDTVRRLQSSFTTLSASLLEQSKAAAAQQVLLRPIPAEVAIWSSSSGRLPVEREAELSSMIGCIKRPKWRFDMTKKEVERNEEGLFRKWLAHTDAVVNDWLKLGEEARMHKQAGLQDGGQNTTSSTAEVMPLSPTAFERNLEVWRQLWRVLELSDILLVLLDSRCPLLHFPPSLQTYLSAPHRVIIVLTKVDIIGPERAAAWQEYLHGQFPGMRIVMVEAYAAKTSQDGGTITARKRKYEPRIPLTFKERLVSTLQEVHQELLQPPPHIRDDPEKLKKWVPRIKRVIDWVTVSSACPSHAHDPSDTPRKELRHDNDRETGGSVEPDFLTIGFIGQPNVGKSSLLNALFGAPRVRASKTPGKTKHFQTTFWTPELRLVDCPGLVLPALIPLELQVLSGILPISRMPAIPMCLTYASHLLPLEKILGLSHPSTKTGPGADKRTWREGMPRREAMEDLSWTAMDIMTAYAEKKGWVTAKAGRVDVNRAGNASECGREEHLVLISRAVLRALVESKIHWAFWPPHTSSMELNSFGSGIWIDNVSGGQHCTDSDDDAGESSEDEGANQPHSCESNEELKEEDEEDEGEDENLQSVGGRFALLRMEEGWEGESSGSDG
ncbi:hypothetical protein K488DRAFT_52165 [Vararia minispora EC-137]|uniref:Uncharacterized protein n=1 Tax=Vararia minispora EC-137 TaxID=1314806 RepID=A0ACB8QHY8_9AGAM|nr:hypothetical protein K488DRAFT_52165 [Vararia minispora EC-137]